MRPRAKPAAPQRRRRDDLLRFHRGRVGVAALALLSILASCAQETDSPEKQIRALVARGEKAAEAKDLDALGKLVADDYRDEEGNDRRALMRFVAFSILQNKSIHLFARVPKIQFPEKHRVEVTAYVAMAGRPIDSAAQLLSINADLYRVDFSAVEASAGTWKVTRAVWRPAELSDFES